MDRLKNRRERRLILQTHKFCVDCSRWLPIEKFKKLASQSALNRNPDGYYWCCSECFKNKTWIYPIGEEPTNRQARRRDKRTRRVIQVETTYGLSESGYMSLINSQNNLCAICGRKDETRVLCVDHDHKTGAVRGLLCNNCNIGLGNLKDDVQILQSAIGYLQKHSKPPEPPEKDKVLL
jgi:hypothetical protein